MSFNEWLVNEARLTDQQKQMIIDLLNAGQKTAAQIAIDVGTSEVTVRRIRDSLPNGAEIRKRLAALRSDLLSQRNVTKWQDEDYRNSMTKMAKDKWDRPEYREKMSRILNDPVMRQSINNKVQQAMLAYWSSPEGEQQRAAASNAMKDNWSKIDFYKDWLPRFSRETQLQILHAIAKRGATDKEFGSEALFRIMAMKAGLIE